ncbi:methyltransferase [Mycolicibacterium rhodesiae]|uniref:Hydroxyneurosporene methyltransferase n=1 Tax=Mycolicibacterium rhodesiae TaxID=36814 RepID=A0A1X0IIT3_MYCRH|nr:methyltransferase [Mycolicibacterium rhodesiae]MCV7343348.1 hydroxyneurosporene methyltransferase [Mycolicibacterium rhodesiae]ORB47507.1 hydroxyneurosporene methyltransferase [Mycolicibacterium rhodesiae]
MTSTKAPPTKLVRVIERARHVLYRTHQRAAPPAASMMELIMGAWTAQLISAAAELGIADELANGPATGEELARRLNVDQDALRRMLRALIGVGVFRHRNDGRYELTALAETLRTDSPVSMAGMARWVGSAQHREHWSHVADAIRTGSAVVPALRGKPIFDYLADEPALGGIFNQAMTGLSESSVTAVVAAYDFSRFATIADIGGGHGRLLAAILASAPQAHGVLFDLPEVVAGAPALLREYGVENRTRIDPGSFFESAPEAADAYVLKHVIHDWPDDDAVRILQSVRTAARLGARVLLIEFVIPDHDRNFHGKWVDIEMLVVANARERTAAEYGQLLERAGFRLERVVDTVGPISILEAVAV